MTVMGLNPAAFYASHAIINGTIILVVIGIAMGIISRGLQFINPVIFILLGLLYGLTMVFLTMFLTTVSSKSQLVFLLVGLVNLLLGVLSWKLSPALHQTGLCLLASLNPVEAFSLGVEIACAYETRSINFQKFSIFE